MCGVVWCGFCLGGFAKCFFSFFFCVCLGGCFLGGWGVFVKSAKCLKGCFQMFS